jgi:hypothetical protein
MVGILGLVEAERILGEHEDRRLTRLESFGLTTVPSDFGGPLS